MKPETGQLAQFAACCCLAEYRPAPAAAARRTPVDLPSRPLTEPSFARRVRLALEAAGDATIVTVPLRPCRHRVVASRTTPSARWPPAALKPSTEFTDVAVESCCLVAEFVKSPRTRPGCS